MRLERRLMKELDEALAFAQKCFDDNMARSGFSFTPSGIFNVAFGPGESLYQNWRERMRAHRPSIIEHPLLYRSIQRFGKQKP